MKKALFTLAIIFTVSLSSVSCTTDSYDSDMEKNNTVTQDNLNVETDPVIIPKKD